jgi:predicted nucleic acid-binding protein
VAGRVLSDASPLIGLARVDGLAWLPALFGTVWLPPEVLAEVLPGRGFAEETALDAALRARWLSACDASPLEPELPDVDEGEAACIRWALRWAGEGVDSLLLMDERAGRALALERGLRVAGTAAVIGMARQRGLIASARDAFERLHRSDFRISPAVIRTVLGRVGEG